MKTPPRLDERFGVVRANTTVLAAALMAAHAAAAESGFRPSDVRFFGYLFANWLERDVLYPGETLDLTQVRRLLLRLVALGWARKVGARAPSKGQGIRYALSRKGTAALMEAIVEAVDSRSFEEAVFVVSLVAGYREQLIALLPEREWEQWATRLDVGRLLGRARRRVERVLHDLTERIASSEKAAREASDLRRAGAADDRIAKRVEQLGVYQLQHIRSFSDFVLSFPPELRDFEIGPGFTFRSRVIFETLAESARAQLRVLDGLQARLETVEPLRGRRARGAGSVRGVPAGIATRGSASLKG
jgi:hypothetical protein